MCISQLYRQQYRSHNRAKSSAETFKENKTTSLYGSAVVDARATSMWHWWLLLLVNRTCYRRQNKRHRIFKHTYRLFTTAMQHERRETRLFVNGCLKMYIQPARKPARRAIRLWSTSSCALRSNMQVNCFCTQAFIAFIVVTGFHCCSLCPECLTWSPVFYD